MSHFKGKYLRVTTPVTTNGTLPMIGPDGKQVYEETYLPVTAAKELEKKNKHLERTGSGHLKMKVEVVG